MHPGRICWAHMPQIWGNKRSSCFRSPLAAVPGCCGAQHHCLLKPRGINMDNNRLPILQIIPAARAAGFGVGGCGKGSASKRPPHS